MGRGVYTMLGEGIEEIVVSVLTAVTVADPAAIPVTTI